MPETYLSTHKFPGYKLLTCRVLVMGSPGDVRVVRGQSAFVKISVLHQTRRVPVPDVIPGTIFALPHAFPTSFPRPSLLSLCRNGKSTVCTRNSSPPRWPPFHSCPFTLFAPAPAQVQSSRAISQQPWLPTPLPS
ncbi:hypothetical protein DFH09DRAFT_1338144 [Mycena vulgaris]|nr:hypothetical protein DFH09DRAFT_1338144 [Mycena vulgaris]